MPQRPNECLRLLLPVLGALLLVACPREVPRDAGTARDAGSVAMVDGGRMDAGGPGDDAGPASDAGPGSDAGPASDAGPIADSGADDAGPVSDGGPMADSGPMSDGGPAGTTVIYPLDDRTFTDDTGSTIEDLDQAASMTLTVSGLAMTLMANDGELNQTNSGFGINASGSGDATDAIDGDAGDEVLTVTFASDVTLLYVDLSGLAGTDEAAISIAGGAPIMVTASGMVDLGGVTLTAGQTLTIAHVAGNGFRVDTIAVSTP